MKFNTNDEGEVIGMVFVSPYNDNPTEPRNVQIICKVNDLKKRMAILSSGIELAMEELKPDEMNRLDKIIIAPNKKSAGVINFVLTKE